MGDLGWLAPITLLTLIGSPVVAPLAARLVASAQSRHQRQILGSLVAIPAVFALGRWLDLRWLGAAANLLWMLAAYLAYGVLAMSSFRIRPRVLGAVLGIVTVLPLAGGVLLGTVGFLGVMFVLGDEIPMHVERMADGRVCQVYGFGNATTSEGGYDVSLRRPLLLFPLVTRIEQQRRWADGKGALIPPLDSLCMATAGTR